VVRAAAWCGKTLCEIGLPLRLKVQNRGTMKRKVYLSPAATAAFASLSVEEQYKINRAIRMLAFPSSTRPVKLQVYRSQEIPKHFIVRLSNSLRLIYHKISTRELVIDDIFRRSSIDGLFATRRETK
jgi:hypothetical protein